MWSGPRNLSTAMMYAFAARGDCSVWDEPFYAAYLAATGANHPMRDEILATHATDPFDIAADCRGPGPGDHPIFYQKQMCHHMIPGFPRDFMRDCVNVFLIRHPARVVASYARKREGPSLADIGVVQQAEMFDDLAHTLGHAPLVIDSDTVRDNPRSALTRLCMALGIPFRDRMLHWEAGPKPFDGAWAPHWYGAVHRSTGFEASEGPLPDLPPSYRALADEALPFYERLALHRL